MRNNVGDESRSNYATLIFFLILTALAVGGMIYMIAPYLLALTIGVILATLVRPLYKRIDHWLKGRRVLSSTLATLIVIFLIVAPVLTFGILAVKQAVNLAQRAIEADVFNLDLLTDRLESWRPIAALFESGDFKEQLRSTAAALGKAISGLAVRMAGSIPEAILQLFLACLACFFVLLDGKKFSNWFADRLPLNREIRERLVRSFEDTAISVIWASMAAAATQAFILFLAFLMLQVPAAFLAGGTTFIFAFIPILGSGPVWVAGAIYLYAQGAFLKMFAMVGVGLFTGLVDNFVRPWVLKGRSEMHPLISLVAIFGGIHLFGFFGVFLGPILIAIAVSLLQIWPVMGYRFGLLEAETASVKDTKPLVSELDED